MLFSEQIPIFLGVLIATALLMKWRRRKELSSYRYPPSLPCLPLVGSLPFIRNLNDISVFFMKKAEELGPIFTLRIANRLVLALNSKEAIEEAYVKNSANFSDRPEVPIEVLINPNSKGIIMQRNVMHWKKTQQLSISVLKEFGFGVKSITEIRVCKEIDAMTDFIKGKNGESFDPLEMCCHVTSNVMMSIIFGRRCDYEMGQSKVTSSIHRLTTDFGGIYFIIPFVRFVPPFRQKVKKMVELATATFGYIESEISQSEQHGAESCFVQSYIQKAGLDFDREQLNYLLRDLVGAGTDTLATALQWSLVALANNPTIQKRLHDEIDAVVAGDRLPTHEDQAKLPYVQATILELSRWRTLVPLSVPRATARDSMVDGYFIPGGTMVIANLRAAHNDINVWKDPEVFRPERFLDSDNNVVGSDQVLPFSAGRRSCLGETLARAELFLIITSLVKRFLILPPEGQDIVNEDPKRPVSPILHPAPFEIRLIERK